jgi:histidinol-phosphate aminotransferase
MIAIANPNNPTGSIAASTELLAIARSAPDAAVLVDEAYFEFCGQTLIGERDRFPNLFVTRTFSKAYGLAGLRIGMLIGNAEQMQAIRRVSSPYNVNAIALACLPGAMTDQDYIQRYVSEVLDGRARLERSLEECAIQFWPSAANFLLMRVGSTAKDAAVFVEYMRQRGILVRDRSNDHGCAGCVRITLGPREHTDRLLEALTSTIAELGIRQGASQI